MYRCHRLAIWRGKSGGRRSGRHGGLTAGEMARTAETPLMSGPAHPDRKLQSNLALHPDNARCRMRCTDVGSSTLQFGRNQPACLQCARSLSVVRQWRAVQRSQSPTRCVWGADHRFRLVRVWMSQPESFGAKLIDLPAGRRTAPACLPKHSCWLE